MLTEAQKIYFREYRRNNREKCNAVLRNWRAKQPGKPIKAVPHTKRENRIAWNKANPDKLKAHRAVYRAVSTGKILRQPCNVCSSHDVQAHHNVGYEKAHWLDVVWLCPEHHRETHRAGRREIHI